MNTTSTESTAAESLARSAQHRRKLLLGFFVVLGLVGMFEGWQWSCMRRSLSRIEQELNRRKVVQVNFPRTELLQLLAGWSAQSSMNTDRGRRDVIVWRGLLHHHVLWVDSNSADEVLAVEIGEELEMAVALQPPDGLPVHRGPSPEEIQKTVAEAFQFFQTESTVDRTYARLRDLSTHLPKAKVSTQRGELLWNELKFSPTSPGMGVVEFTSPFNEPREFDLVVCASAPVRWNVITSAQSNERVLPLPSIREESGSIPGILPEVQRAVYFQSIPGRALQSRESYLMLFTHEDARASAETSRSSPAPNASTNTSTDDITVKFLLFLSPVPTAPAQNSWRRTADEIAQHLGLNAGFARLPATPEGLVQAFKRCDQSFDRENVLGLQAIPKTLRQVAPAMRELRPSESDKPEWISLRVTADAPFDAIRIRAPSADHQIVRAIIVTSDQTSAQTNSRFAVEDALPGETMSTPWRQLTEIQGEGLPLSGPVTVFLYTASVIADKDIFLWHKNLSSSECSLMAAAMFELDDYRTTDVNEELAVFGIELAPPAALPGSHVLSGFGVPISHLLFTPDGQRLISINKTGQVQSWEAASQSPLPALADKSKFLNHPSVSADGRTLACVATLDHQIKWWELDTGRQLGLIDYRSALKKDVWACTFGRSTTQLTLMSGHFYQNWKVEEVPLSFHTVDLEQKTISGDEGKTSGGVETFQYLPALNSYVAVVGRPVPRPKTGLGSDASEQRSQRHIHFWRDHFRRAPTELLLDESAETAETNNYSSKLTVSADGRRLLAISPAGQARLWDTATLTEISSRKFDTPTLAVALSPDGSQFAISFADAPILYLMDSTSGEVRSSFPVGADGMISKVAFASDGRWIATGTLRGMVRLWDTKFSPRDPN